MKTTNRHYRLRRLLHKRWKVRVFVWKGILENIISYYSSAFTIKQIDFLLPCVCSVIDHRWLQNMVKTKKWHTSRRQVQTDGIGHGPRDQFYLITSLQMVDWFFHLCAGSLFDFRRLSSDLRLYFLEKFELTHLVSRSS